MFKVVRCGDYIETHELNNLYYIDEPEDRVVKIQTCGTGMDDMLQAFRHHDCSTLAGRAKYGHEYHDYDPYERGHGVDFGESVTHPPPPLPPLQPSSAHSPGETPTLLTLLHTHTPSATNVAMQMPN